MNDEPVVQAPARLMEEPTELGSLLTQTEAEFRRSLDERKAWKRIQPSLDALLGTPRSRYLRLLMSASIALSAMAIGWYAGVRYARHSAPSLPSTRGPSQSAPPPLISMALNSGESVLSDGTRILVGRDTQGRYTRDADGGHIILAEGRVDVFVPEASKGEGVAIACGQYEFRARGSRLSLSLHARCVVLDVAQGSVPIFNGRNPVEVATAGAHWASEECNIEP